MVARSKRLFVGFGILCFAIACQPATPTVVSGNALALTVTAFVQLLTAQASPAAVSTETNIVVSTSTAVVITGTQAAVPTEVPATLTSAFSMSIVDAEGTPVDPNPAEPQSQPSPQNGASTAPPPQPGATVSPSPTAAPPVQQFGSIYGYVLFQKTSQNKTPVTPVPVVGMNVTVRAGHSTQTKQADPGTGYYTFSDVPAGPVIIEFNYANYMTQKLKNIIVDPGQPADAGIFYVTDSVPNQLPTPCGRVICTLPTLENKLP